MALSSPIQDVLLVSPRQRDAYPNKRRRTTPSPESLLPKTSVVLCTDTIQPQILFAPEEFNFTVIEPSRPSPHEDSQNLTHGHPHGGSQVLVLPTAREIITSFNLREHPAKFLERENHDILFCAMPNVQRVEFDDRILVYLFTELPPRPWPKMIAGVPCYFTSDPNDRGPLLPIFRRSRSAITISPSIDLRDNEAAVGLIFDLTRDFFVNARISITEIQFWGHLVIIVLESNAGGDEVLRAVPRSIATCQCFYLFESEIGRPTTLLAKRIKEASLGTIDESHYDTLRPGIILSSGLNDKGEEMRTSSGVLLRNQQGIEFITAASHGFTSSGQVYHPNSLGQPIGEFIMEISHTDIALIRLNEGVNFVNETFENSVYPSPSFTLQPFIRAAETRLGDPVFFDSPFSGLVMGTKMAHSLQRIPIDDPLEPKQIWIRCSWDYIGQDSNRDMVEGVCGSALWNVDHRVLGFFRYALTEGIFRDYCLSVAADHLIEEGYAVV
ncbi:hypothetical protein N7460_011795 [Penicillium canescens]|uniref:Uncharacterized protein n=2 Tax=Penicillium canescens TaxID=5083 RepID=A0AAD6I1C8_PENCN|nr:hypothetical protein N7460_011795 [Penicillium canescens]